MTNIKITGVVKGAALLIGAVMISASCNKFLDTPSDNRTEVDDENKVLQLLVSAYPGTTDSFYTTMMTDDCDDVGTGYGGGSDYFRNIQDEAWRWDNVTYIYQDSPNASWQDSYSGIATANQALVAIKDLGGPVTDKLKAAYGEAYLLRAFHHFQLVKLFCMPYDTRYAELDLGVPYLEKPETTVNPKYDRGTLAEVYAKIDKDITEGLPYISDAFYQVEKYHFNVKAAHAFAAEFYLFYKQYQKAIDHASIVLGSNAEASIRDVSIYRSLPQDASVQGLRYRSPSDPANLLISATTSYSAAFITVNWSLGKRFRTTRIISAEETLHSPSVLWQLAANFNSFIMPGYNWNGGDGPDYVTRLTGHYEFQTTDPQAATGYWMTMNTEFSTDDCLLIRAEANVMLNQLDEAMNDLNAWRNKRVDPRYNTKRISVQEVAAYYGTYGANPTNHQASPDETLQTTNTGTLRSYSPRTNEGSPKKQLRIEAQLTPEQEAMLHAVLHVRRIEFWGEGKRWQDIRRHNIKIYRRQYRTGPGNGTIMGDERTMDYLKERDPRMAIQIPNAVIAAGLQANPR